MEAETLKVHLRRQPFVSFRIEKIGGAWFEITNPEMRHVSRRSVELGLPIENGGQRFVTIALIHVTTVDIVLPTISS